MAKEVPTNTTKWWGGLQWGHPFLPSPPPHNPSSLDPSPKLFNPPFHFHFNGTKKEKTFLVVKGGVLTKLLVLKLDF